MRNTYYLLGTILLAAACGSAWALESATTGSQATQATVGVINSKVDTTNAIINNILACNNARKFYAPTDAKKDANGCVGIQDYQLTMNTPNGISANTGSAATGLAGYSDTGVGVYGFSNNGNWAGEFVGGAGSALGYGVYASSPQVALEATNTGSSNWTTQINSNNSPYGLYVHTTASSAYGLYIDNPNNNAQLCLNGSCVTSLGSAGGHEFGGMFVTQWAAANGAYFTCVVGNPYSTAPNGWGYCDCPAGYTQYSGPDTINGNWDDRIMWCIR